MTRVEPRDSVRALTDAELGELAQREGPLQREALAEWHRRWDRRHRGVIEARLRNQEQAHRDQAIRDAADRLRAGQAARKAAERDQHRRQAFYLDMSLRLVVWLTIILFARHAIIDIIEATRN